MTRGNVVVGCYGGNTAAKAYKNEDGALVWCSDDGTWEYASELMQQGQFALNQCNFLEWIGQANSLGLEVPCYDSGTRELGTGRSVILMLTDGLLEHGDRPFENPQRIWQVFAEGLGDGRADLEVRVLSALTSVHLAGGRDSATVIAWTCDRRDVALWPSR